VVELARAGCVRDAGGVPPTGDLAPALLVGLELERPCGRDADARDGALVSVLDARAGIAHRRVRGRGGRRGRAAAAGRELGHGGRGERGRRVVDRLRHGRDRHVVAREVAEGLEPALAELVERVLLGQRAVERVREVEDVLEVLERERVARGPARRAPERLEQAVEAVRPQPGDDLVLFRDVAQARRHVRPERDVEEAVHHLGQAADTRTVSTRHSGRIAAARTVCGRRSSSSSARSAAPRRRAPPCRGGRRGRPRCSRPRPRARASPRAR
jgi:hypothetical protein